MSNYNDDSGQHAGDKKRIEEASARVIMALEDFNDERPDISRHTKKEFAKLLATYRNFLYQYRNERVLEPPWDERPVDVDLIQELLNHKKMVDVPLDRRGAAANTKPVTAVEMVEPQLLVEIANELNDIRKELGFADKPATSREVYNIASPDAEDHPEPVNDNVSKPGQ